MSDYHVKHETITVGGTDYLIRSLLNLQQYSDPQDVAKLAGISPVSWLLFVHSWPSAQVLTLAMQAIELAGKRIMEIGACLVLASLVFHRRTGDMAVSDWHPLSQTFLNENLLLNKLGPLKCQIRNWEGSNSELGQFGLIIGSDVLYERQQPSQLAAFIHSRHAAPSAQVIIVDQNRGNRVRFCREMIGLGYGFTTRCADSFIENGYLFKGRFLTFKRSQEL